MILVDSLHISTSLVNLRMHSKIQFLYHAGGKVVSDDKLLYCFIFVSFCVSEDIFTLKTTKTQICWIIYWFILLCRHP